MPKRNYEIRIEGKRLFLDTAWPDKQVYAEIHGKSFHFMAEDWENDLSRQNALSGLLWLPLRYSGRALRRDAPVR